MTQFVLVHGSFQGGWIWQPTLAILRAAGHDVFAPTLDGCAERKVNLRLGISVTLAAEELAEALFYEDLQDVVLVGTSSGGLVVEKTAALAREISTPVIASGGVSGHADLQALKAVEDAGIEGVICGRALYDGRIEAATALALLAA